MANYHDELICDLAETYHIYNYKEFPPSSVALFSIGLRENSRVKIKLSNIGCTFEQLMFAKMVDNLSLLVWSKTKDAQKGKNPPISIANKLLNINTENKDTVSSFRSVEDFERAKQRILQKGG